MRSKLRSMQGGTTGSAQGFSTQFQLPNGGTVNLGQLRTSVKADLKQIQSRLTSDAAQNGVDIGAGVSVQVDSSGMAHVLGSSAATSGTRKSDRLGLSA